MKYIKVKIIHSTVNILFKEIPLHELPLLQTVQKEEQATPVGSAHKTNRSIPNIDEEYSRLCARYGSLAVQQVYGPLESGRLKEAIDEANNDSGETNGEPK